MAGTFYNTPSTSLAVLIFVICVTGSDVLVSTKYGTIRGIKTDKVNEFLGVPYAAPPIENLRWQPPVEPKAWSPAVYNATKLMPGCPQHGCRDTNPSFVCPNKTSESCLFLNIWTPLDSRPNSSYPVMVYLHGGNFVHMSASSPVFRGDDFVLKGKVIYVAVDYRLGVLGFLYTGESASDAKGNYGIQDQRLALIWVQQNIKNFGGDPNKVTLFGQSAGAQSSAIHLISEKSKGLFRNVILESSPFDIPLKNPYEALYLASIVRQLLNCTGMEYMTCLRSKTFDEIAEAQHTSRAEVTSLKLLEFFEPLGPFVDGREIKMELIDAAQQGKIFQVPTMIGTTKEETRIFIYSAWTKPLSQLDYIAVLYATYPTHLESALKMYPIPPGANDTRDLLTELGTDFIFTCVARNVSQNLITHGEASVYRYVFDHAFSFDGWGNFTYCEGHVCHGEEIAFVFHSADQSGYNFDKDEEVLSDSMIYYWTNFAYSSDPNKGPHSVKLRWPKYDTNKPSVIRFKTPENEIIPSPYRKEFCDYWDSIGYIA